MPTRPLGSAIYDAVGNVVASVDQLGRRTTASYDALNRAYQTTDALGNLATVVFDAASNPIATVNARGYRTTTTFDKLNRPVQVQDALGGLATIVYDAAGNTLATVDPLGNRTSYTLDALNRQTEVKDALGNVASTLYDKASNIVASVDPLGHRTSYGYDALNRPVTTTDALGNVASVVYDKASNVLASIDPLGHRTSYGYDSLNRQVTTQDALGNVATTAYDAVGNVQSQTNPPGYTTSFVYDPLDRLIQSTDALGNLSTVVFDAVGNTLATVDARGYRTTSTFDALNREISQTDPLNHTTSVAYDAVGNAIKFTDALGNVTTAVFDALDRQLSVQDPGGGIATTVYDAADNVLATVDPLGNRTSYLYDKLNRVIQSTDPLGALTTAVFDAAGNQTALVDPLGNRTSFVFDALNRVIEQDDPLNAKTTMAYDAAGRETSQTDRLGRRKDFSFDNADRLTGETWRDAGGSVVNTVTLTLDANGNFLTAANANGVYTSTYDALDRVGTQAGPFGLLLTFGYDAVGNRTLDQDSKGGVLTSTYDGDNQLTSRQLGGAGLTPLRFDIAYTARNQVGTLTRYSDLAGTTKVGESDSTYDNAGRLTNLQIKDGSGTVLGNYTTTYDLASRATSETIDGTTTSFGYDTVNQLTSAGASNYGYDLAGNRNTAGYTVGADNRMTSDGVNSYSYDAEGNRTKKTNSSTGETWTSGYDNNDQMTWTEDRATDGGTLLLRLDEKYDVFGRRIEEDRWTAATGTVVTHFGYDDGRDVWADLDSNNALQTRYVRQDGPDTPVARETGGGTVGWYGSDREGSVRLNLSATGALLNRNAYDAYGQRTSQSSPSNGDRFAYTGAELQADLGVQLHDLRWYDPKTGRWTSEDPAGFAAGDSNLGRYVGNGPTNATDPSGLAGHSVDPLPIVAPRAPTGGLQELLVGLVRGDGQPSSDPGVTVRLYKPPSVPIGTPAGGDSLTALLTESTSAYGGSNAALSSEPTNGPSAGNGLQGALVQLVGVLGHSLGAAGSDPGLTVRLYKPPSAPSGTPAGGDSLTALLAESTSAAAGTPGGGHAALSSEPTNGPSAGNGLQGALVQLVGVLGHGLGAAGSDPGVTVRLYKPPTAPSAGTARADSLAGLLTESTSAGATQGWAGAGSPSSGASAGGSATAAPSNGPGALTGGGLLSGLAAGLGVVLTARPGPAGSGPGGATAKGGYNPDLGPPVDYSQASAEPSPDLSALRLLMDVGASAGGAGGVAAPGGGTAAQGGQAPPRASTLQSLLSGPLRGTLLAQGQALASEATPKGGPGKDVPRQDEAKPAAKPLDPKPSARPMTNDEINMMLFALSGGPVGDKAPGGRPQVGMFTLLAALMAPDEPPSTIMEPGLRELYTLEGFLEIDSEKLKEDKERNWRGPLVPDIGWRTDRIVLVDKGEWPGDPDSHVVVVVVYSPNPNYDRLRPVSENNRPHVPTKVAVFRVGEKSKYQSIDDVYKRALADLKANPENSIEVKFHKLLGYLPLTGTAQKLDEVLQKIQAGKPVTAGEWAALGLSFGEDVLIVAPGLFKGADALNKLSRAKLLKAVKEAREARLISLSLREGPKCFAAGTPLLTPEGEKAVECLRPGDLLLSRAEEDVAGAIEAKTVEEVFIRVALVLALQIRGRVIRTTAEHPFYVFGRGWVSACQLHAGDLLASHDGQVIPVEHVAETREVMTVYNVRVADYHTYFVGCEEWGFSVWAHNLNECVLRGEIKVLKEQRASLQIGSKGHQAATQRIQQLEAQLKELVEAKVPTSVKTNLWEGGDVGNTWIKYPNGRNTTSSWQRLEGSRDVQMTLDKYQIGSNPPRSGLGTEYIRQAVQQSEKASGGRVASIVAELGEDNLAVFRRTGRIEDTPLHKSMVSLGYKNVRRVGNQWIWW